MCKFLSGRIACPVDMGLWHFSMSKKLFDMSSMSFSGYLAYGFSIEKNE